MTAIDPAPPAVAVGGTSVDAIEAVRRDRQNAYLKLRCAQLQDDVMDLSSQVTRLQQELERVRGRRADPLAGGRP
jgi:hypothetical protein